jgi:hypothetical protein
MSDPDQFGVQLCSACRGDYEDPDASTTEGESSEPDNEEEDIEEEIDA